MEQKHYCRPPDCDCANHPGTQWETWYICTKKERSQEAINKKIKLLTHTINMYEDEVELLRRELRELCE